MAYLVSEVEDLVIIQVEFLLIEASAIEVSGLGHLGAIVLLLIQVVEHEAA